MDITKIWHFVRLSGAGTCITKKLFNLWFQNFEKNSKMSKTTWRILVIVYGLGKLLKTNLLAIWSCKLGYNRYLFFF